MELILPLLTNANFKEFLQSLGFGSAMFVVFLVMAVMLFNESRKRDKDSRKRAEIMDKGFDKIVNGFDAAIGRLDESFTKTFKDHEAIEMHEIKRINTTSKETQSIVKKEARDIKMMNGSHILEPDDAVDTLLAHLWIGSKHKLDYIEDILIKNHIETRKDEIKKNIKAELEDISNNTYIKRFSKCLISAGNGNMLDWFNSRFTKEDFNNLLSKIYEVVFKKYPDEMDSKLVVALKIKDIGSIMKHLHNTLGTKLRVDIEEGE